jgi:hypothetical protein
MLGNQVVCNHSILPRSIPGLIPGCSRLVSETRKLDPILLTVGAINLVNDTAFCLIQTGRGPRPPSPQIFGDVSRAVPSHCLIKIRNNGTVFPSFNFINKKRPPIKRQRPTMSNIGQLD